MWVHSGGSVGEIPDGYPGDSDCEGGPKDPIVVDEDDIQYDIENKSHEENFYPFLYTSDSGQYLEVNLEKEITYYKECRILKDNSGGEKLLSEEYTGDGGTEYEHKHTSHNSEHGKIFIEESFNGGDFSFLSFPVKLRDNRK